MKSLETATPGTRSRARRTRSTYASLVYPRRMRSNTVVLPLCAGMCSCLHTFGLDAMTFKTSSGKSFGCGDVKRTRISGSTPATSSRSSAKSNAFSRRAPGLYTDLNPLA